MTLKEFMNSEKGSKLAPLFTDPGVIARMEAITRRGRPAVKAIDGDVALAVGSLDNVEKQHVGRWVRDILALRGLRPIRQLDWRGGKVFASGAVYGPIAAPQAILPDTPPGPASNKVEQARALLAAGRIDGLRCTDTIDDFLAERRAIWGEA
jgi:hypothetical protein